MINGGPNPLFVKAMVVPSREVVVRFSPIDFTVCPLEYQITNPPTATIARITANVIRCMEPPVLYPRSASAQFAPSRCGGSKTQTDSLRYRGYASRDRGKVGGEVFKSLSRAGIDAHLEHSVAILPGRAVNGHRQLRFLPLLREDKRRTRLGIGRRSEDELFWRGDFPVDAGERVSLPAIGSAVNPAKRTAGPQIDLANCQRHTARVPPVCDVFGPGPRLEDKGARRIEEPRYHDLAVAGSRNCDWSDVIDRSCLSVASSVHVFSPCFASLSGTRPGWQISAPRTSERAQSNRQYP